MGIKALDGLTVSWYTPEGQEEDDEKPTRFKCKPLNGEEYNSVVDNTIIVGISGRISSAGQALCLRFSLQDWENLESSKGGFVEYSRKSHCLIDFKTRTALVAHILEISSLSEDQIKN